MSCLPGTRCYDDSNPPALPEGVSSSDFIGYPIISNFIYYSGQDLPNSGIVTNEFLTVALEKIDPLLSATHIAESILEAMQYNPVFNAQICEQVNLCLGHIITTTTTTATPTTTTTTSTAAPTTTTTTTASGGSTTTTTTAEPGTTTTTTTEEPGTTTTTTTAEPTTTTTTTTEVPATTTSTTTAQATTTSTTTAGPVIPTFSFFTNTGRNGYVAACSATDTIYLWAFSDTWGSGETYYQGTETGPDVPLVLYPGADQWFEFGEVAIQIDDLGVSYNDTSCSGTTSTTTTLPPVGTLFEFAFRTSSALACSAATEPSNLTNIYSNANAADLENVAVAIDPATELATLDYYLYTDEAMTNPVTTNGYYSDGTYWYRLTLGTGKITNAGQCNSTTTTTTTTIQLPIFSFNTNSGRNGSTAACTATATIYLWSFADVWGSSTTYYQGDVNGPDVPLVLYPGADQWFAFDGVAIQIADNGVSYNDTSCASLTTTTTTTLPPVGTQFQFAFRASSSLACSAATEPTNLNTFYSNANEADLANVAVMVDPATELATLNYYLYTDESMTIVVTTNGYYSDGTYWYRLTLSTGKITDAGQCNPPTTTTTSTTAAPTTTTTTTTIAPTTTTTTTAAPTTTTTTLPPVSFTIASDCIGAGTPGTGRITVSAFTGGNGTYSSVAIAGTLQDALAATPTALGGATSWYWLSLANNPYYVVLRDSLGNWGYKTATVSCTATTTTTSTTLPPVTFDITSSCTGTTQTITISNFAGGDGVNYYANTTTYADEPSAGAAAVTLVGGPSSSRTYTSQSASSGSYTRYVKVTSGNKQKINSAGACCDNGASYTTNIGTYYYCSAGSVLSTTVYQNSNACYTGANIYYDAVHGATSTNYSNSSPSTAATWVDNGIYRCNTSSYPCVNEKQQTDTNPCSPTFEQNRWVYDPLERSCNTSAVWVNRDISTYWNCVGVDKHYQQIDTNFCSPTYNTTQTGALYEANSPDCGYVPPSYTLNIYARRSGLIGNPVSIVLNSGSGWVDQTTDISRNTSCLFYTSITVPTGTTVSIAQYRTTDDKFVPAVGSLTSCPVTGDFSTEVCQNTVVVSSNMNIYIYADTENTTYGCPNVFL